MHRNLRRQPSLTGRLFGIVVIAAASMVLAGCSASAPQQHMGRTYLEAGDYDRAVQAAQQAVAKDPDNADAQDLLIDAQTAAADYHCEQAKKFVADHRPSQAAAEIEKTLGYMPAHPGANTLKVPVAQSIAECNELTDKGRAAAAREDWEQAINLAKQACSIDAGDARATELLDSARLAVVSKHLADAQAALNAGNAADCLAACERAANYEPNNAYMLQLKRKAQVAGESDTAVASASPDTAAAQSQPAVAAMQPKDVAASPSATDATTPTATAVPAATPLIVASASPAPAEPEPPQSAESAVVANVPPAEPQTAAPPTTQPAALEPLAPAETSAAIAVPSEPTPEQTTGTAAEKPSGSEMTITVRPSSRQEKLIEVQLSESSSADSAAAASNRPTARSLPGATFWKSNARPEPRPAPYQPIEVASRPAGSDAENAWGARHAADGDTYRSTSNESPVTGKAPSTQPVEGRIVDARMRSERPAVPTPANPEGHLFVGTISRSDRQFKKQIGTVDNISVKVKDTDGDPLDADLEIVAGSFRAAPKDMAPHAAVRIRGSSGKIYKLTILWIHHDKDTVCFCLDRLN